MATSPKISELVHTLLDGMHTLSKSETIIGDPYKAGDATLIPVHRLRVGFAAGAASAGARAGGSEGAGGSRGAAGAVQIDPVAVIAVGKDGLPRILAVDGEAEGSWRHLLDQLPELLSRGVKLVADEVAARPNEPQLAKEATKALAEAADPKRLPAK